MSKEFKQHKKPHGPMNAGMSVEKAKDFKGTIKKLMDYMGRYKIGIFFVMLFAAASSVFAVIGPKIVGKITTKIFNGLTSKMGGGTGIDFDGIFKIILIMIGLYLLSSLFAFIQGLIMTGITQNICYRMRKEMTEKINRLPMNYFDKKANGEVLSYITNDVDTLGMGLNQSITQLITSVATLIGILIMMLTISPLLTLIALAIIPLSGICVGFVVHKSQKYFKQQQEYLGHVNGQVEEVFGGHNVIRVFNKEKSSIETFEKTNETLYESAWKSQFLSGLMMPAMNFIGNLGYAAVAVFGGFLAIKKTIEVGDIVSFIQYVKSFTQPISQMAQVSNMIQSMTAAAERVFEFLGEDEEQLLATEHSDKDINSLVGDVEFKNVSFGYNPEKIIVNNFSVKVKQGQKVAIVGPTGAGKTTIVKLLMKFYDINSGDILVDGESTSKYDRSELRELFGMVLQDTWLFKGTIMENIRYGRLDATDEEVIAAAKSAHAHHFIKTLPDGYNMELNEEASNVSQGQKQLLTIARAILAQNKILILDEATSSVDTRTEERIQKAMDNLMKGRTSFIIAHRLSTIKNADIILVMKDGDIIEQGSHDELMAQNGFYANLYNSQFEQGVGEA